jgi:hypothetical protein
LQSSISWVIILILTKPRKKGKKRERDGKKRNRVERKREKKW